MFATMALLSKKQVGLILLFTIIELVTLTVWLMILGVATNITLTVAVTAGIVLFVGLLIEHTIAIVAGDFPAKGAVKPQDGS
jgi:hypothetical protein